MNPSHYIRADPAAPSHRKPLVYVRAKDIKFSVLRLAPQYPAGPEFVVCAGSNALAHFFEQKDAEDYCQWRNQPETERVGKTP
jgi:hypothetical protein